MYTGKLQGAFEHAWRYHFRRPQLDTQDLQDQEYSHGWAMTTSIDDVCWGNWLQNDHLEIVSDVLLVTEQPNLILGQEICLMVCVVGRRWNQCYMDPRQLDDDALILVSQRHVKWVFGDVPLSGGVNAS